MRLAEALGGDHLEIPIGVHLIGRFMGDDLDAGVAGLLQHRLENVGVVRHDADHVDALGDQILDGAHLQCRIGAGRTDHEAVIAKLLGLLLMPVSMALNHGMPPILTTTPTFTSLAKLCVHRSQGKDHGQSRNNLRFRKHFISSVCFVFSERLEEITSRMDDVPMPVRLITSLGLDQRTNLHRQAGGAFPSTSVLIENPNANTRQAAK